MTEPMNDLEQNVVEPAAHPIETGKGLAKEADRGTSERTPAIALTGVTMVVAAIVAAVLLVVVIAYVIA